MADVGTLCDTEENAEADLGSRKDSGLYLAKSPAADVSTYGLEWKTGTSENAWCCSGIASIVPK
jgi:hypothetical protein